MDAISDAEDDVYEFRNSRSSSSRSDLYIARSRLRSADGSRLDCWGLYCHNNIKRGEFIGLYTGIWTHESEETMNTYSLRLSIGAVVTPPTIQLNQTVTVQNPELYPTALANEPKRNDSANASLHEWVLDRSEVSNIPSEIRDERFFCAGIAACANISKNTEIRWFYGDLYQTNRNYNPGKQCKSMHFTPQHPMEGLRNFGIYYIHFDAVTPFISTPSTSSDEQDDPTYGGILRKLFSFLT